MSGAQFPPRILSPQIWFGIIVALTALLTWLQQPAAPALLNAVVGALLVVLLGLLATSVLARMLSGDINLSGLLAEADGDASMSRFQFLIFTFIVAGSYVLLQMQTKSMVEIPAGVLGLIGISGGTYAGAKIVQKTAETTQHAAAQQTEQKADDNRTAVATAQAAAAKPR